MSRTAMALTVLLLAGTASAQAPTGEIVCPWGQVFGEVQVKLDGKAEVNGYHPPAETFTDDATVRSNELVRLDGNARIGGNAVSGGEVEQHGPNTEITGAIVEDAPLLDFCCLEDWINHFSDESLNDNENIPNTTEGDDPYDGDKLTVKHGDSLTLPAGTYYFEEVDIKGTLHVGGSVRLFIEETLQVNGQGVVNPDASPLLLQIFSADHGNNAIQLTGNAKVAALIYAMCGETHMSGNAILCGAVATEELHVSGNAVIHYTHGAETVCFFVEAEYLTECSEEEEEKPKGPKDE